MTDKPYITLLTKYGEDRITQAAISGIAINFSEMAVGDGGGIVPTPVPSQTRLVNEVYRAPLNRVVVADDAANIICAELIILAQVGGFWMREAALYDDKGKCLAIASLPPSYKPQLVEGSGRLHTISLCIAVSNTACIELKADPDVILATVNEVRKGKNEVKDYVDHEISVLNKDISETITLALENAKTSFWDLDNPIGTVRFFNQNINPNELWPHSVWIYTGENKSIRVAAASGSNIGSIGGSDTAKIQVVNLPAVQIDISGETSEKESVSIRTVEAGNHQHGTFGEAAGIGNWPYGYYDTAHEYLGTSKSDADNALMNSTLDGSHYHDITLPAHSHHITGKTVELGQGQDLSIVESHIMLMCWSRVA